MARCVLHVGCRARQTFPPLEPALWRASGVPKVVFGPAGGSRAVGEWVGLTQLRCPGTVADAVGRCLAEWAS